MGAHSIAVLCLCCALYPNSTQHCVVKGEQRKEIILQGRPNKATHVSSIILPILCTLSTPDFFISTSTYTVRFAFKEHIFICQIHGHMCCMLSSSLLESVATVLPC